jgi:hypothetical protein
MHGIFTCSKRELKETRKKNPKVSICRIRH